MGEIEERLLKFGYPEMDSNDEGQCCEDNTPEGMTCQWQVQRVELPQPPSFDGTGAGDAGLNLGGLASIVDGGSSAPMSPGAAAAYGGLPQPGMLPNGVGAVGALFAAGSNDGGLISAAGGADGGLQALGSMMGGATTTGVAGLAPLVMTIVYPSLKPMLEASIRKVIVTVKWRDGLRPRELQVTQYVTNPMKGGFTADPMASGMPGMPGMPGGATPFGASTTGGTTNTSGGGLTRPSGLGGLFGGGR